MGLSPLGRERHVRRVQVLRRAPPWTGLQGGGGLQRVRFVRGLCLRRLLWGQGLQKYQFAQGPTSLGISLQIEIWIWIWIYEYIWLVPTKALYHTIPYFTFNALLFIA